MSETLEQVPFADPGFAENPEPRCACLLLLDNSGSMSGSKLAQLNEGLKVLRDELYSDALAAKRVEVGIVTFGPVKVELDFTSAQVFQAPELGVGGNTPMGEAIETGLSLLRNRKDAYKNAGVSYYRPWVFLITDGEPTDSTQRAAELIQEGERSKAFSFYAIGVDGANLATLQQIAVKQPLMLKGLQFKEMFAWLSSSLGAVSKSVPGDQVPLENPTTPTGWLPGCRRLSRVCRRRRQRSLGHSFRRRGHC
jgi:uncharacterized protein YegL